MPCCDFCASVTDESSELVLPNLSFDGLVAQILAGHPLTMRKAVDVQNEYPRLVDDGGLLEEVIFFAFAASKALHFPSGLELERLVVSKTVNVGELVTLFGPGFATAFTDVTTGCFYLEEFLK